MIGFVTTILILLCLFITILVLLLRTSGGMGSAMGGGAADQVLGAGSQSQLTKMTVWSVLAFFALAFVLYILYQAAAEERSAPTRAGQSESGAVPGAGPSSPSTPAAQTGNATALPVFDLNTSKAPVEKNIPVPVDPIPPQPEANAPAPSPSVPTAPEGNASAVSEEN